MATKAFEQVIVENALRGAIFRKEFELVFQPQFKLIDQQLIGLEVLLRWNHPELGAIPPSRFIPIAEGVETADQVDFLIEHDCFSGQGYYFNHPLSYPDTEKLLLSEK